MTAQKKIALKCELCGRVFRTNNLRYFLKTAREHRETVHATIKSKSIHYTVVTLL
jgi:hypothetical protein